MTELSHKTLTLPKWLLGTDRKVENTIDKRASTWETGVVPESKQVSVAEHCVQLVDYDRHKVAFRPYLMNCLRAFRKQKADRAHEFEILSEIDPTTRQWPIFLIHYGPSASVLDFAFEKLLHIDDAECWQQPVLVCRILRYGEFTNRSYTDGLGGHPRVSLSKRAADTCSGATDSEIRTSSPIESFFWTALEGFRRTNYAPSPRWIALSSARSCGDISGQ